MNCTNFEFNDLIGLEYDYNELDSNWRELDCIIEVPCKISICCDLLRYINKLN